MKAILKSTLLLCASVALFSACDKDLDNNPTLQTPDTFVLNTPSYAAQTIDLKVAEGLNFTWSQPDYSFPVAAEYGMQFSTTNKWTKSVDQIVDMETERGDYATVGTPTGVCKAMVAAADLATAIEKIERYEEGKAPATQDLYARVYSLVNGDTIYSNAVKVSVAPYYVELSDAPVETWYLIGSCIGDGSWGNDQVIPLLPLEGQEYDKKTGKGVIAWTGYLDPSGFKLKKNLDNWNEQWGQGAAFGEFTHNDGGSGNITVPKAGYYTVTLDTKSNKLKVEEYTGKVTKVFTSMAIPGTQNGWDQVAGNLMTPGNTKFENHDWKATVTFDAKAGAEEGCKFTANGAWDDNWGSVDFPYGVGTNGGKNILYKKGTYSVYFNDITGQYTFIKQK
ncbi:MAG: SusF/SusE family outer membrane protein [Prevotella sp.]|nr:SusF/SusE family outer membrane protein [Prevotella sp.]